MKTSLGIAPLVFGILIPGVVAAATIRVPSEVATIPAAIDASSPGDTVLVAPGTYQDVVVKDLGGGIVFTLMGLLKNNLVVASEPGPEATIVDMGTSPLTGFTTYFLAIGLTSAGTTIEGFTFLGAGTDVRGITTNDGETSRLNVRSCKFLDMESSGGGGSAVVGVFADLNVEDCVFERCISSGEGGAVTSQNANLTMSNCTVQECVSFGGAVAASSIFLGRPIRCEIVNSHFINNRLHEKSVAGAAIMKAGGGLSHFTVVGCTFVGNEAPDGGGIAAYGHGNKVIKNCVFRNNRATTGSAGAIGITDPGNIVISGNVFVGNSNADGWSGSALILGFAAGGSEINHNIFAWNSGGPAFYVAPTATGSIEGCNLFWQNSGGDLVGQVPAASDLFLDPEFCDWESGNFTLREGSPCLQTPSNNCGLLGPFDVGCGAVSIDAESWGQIKAKYRSGNR